MGWYEGNEALFQNILLAALVAFSIQVALRAGVFSLAGIGCYGLGSYTVGILTLRDVPPLLALIAGVVVGGVVSWLLARLLVRLRGLYLAMATVAFDLMVVTLATNGGDLTGEANGLFGLPLAVQTWHLAAVVITAAALLTGLERRRLGRAIEIVREDEPLAETLAIDTRAVQRFAFVLSGVLGALAGGLHAMLVGSLNPQDSGFSLIVLALTMAVVGGTGSWFGAFLGAALLTWMPLLLQGFDLWWDVIYGSLMIVVAIWVPGGLLGFVRSAWTGVRVRWLGRSVGPSPAALPGDGT